MAEDQMLPPCDVGGLDACWMWESHDASPGEAEDCADTRAITLYYDMRRLGLENVLRLKHLELTRREADELAQRLSWLVDNYPEYERQNAPQQSTQE